MEWQICAINSNNQIHCLHNLVCKHPLKQTSTKHPNNILWLFRGYWKKKNHTTTLGVFHAYFLLLIFLLPFQMKSVLMAKNSLSCHGVTALVYSPASVWDPEGLAVTRWHHFIQLVENERRVPCSFMILSHLARFLLLLVCLMPRAWKIENMLFCSPSLSFSISVGECVLQLQTPTQKCLSAH